MWHRILDTGEQFDALRDLIAFEQRSVVVYGTTYPQPRLTKWYGPKDYMYSGLVLSACPMPEPIERLRRTVEDETGSRFNSVLCNLYRDGLDRIHWHSDDEPEFGVIPDVASLSFGSVRTFRMRRKDDHKIQQSFQLGDQSLFYMEPGVQSGWQHCIVKTTKPTGPRINLTFRRLV